MFLQKSFFHLRALRYIHTALTDDIAVSITIALIQSRLDYANSVCYGISASNLAKLQLQRVQNVAARIVAHHQSKGPASSHLSNLHWLPIKHRINIKIATLTYKILAIGQPGYLHTLLNTYQPVCNLRSRDSQLLAKPPVYTSIGRHTMLLYKSGMLYNSEYPQCTISRFIQT